MLRITLLATIAFAALGTARHATGEDVLFEDNFDGTLSPKWQAVGLAKDDYRIRDGGLEMRVQTGRRTGDTPMLLVLLPFKTSESVIASVEVTLLDRFTEPDESAGLFLTDADSREFGAEKRNLDGLLVFSPGNDEFIGEERVCRWTLVRNPCQGRSVEKLFVSPGQRLCLATDQRDASVPVIASYWLLRSYPSGMMIP